MQCSIQTRKTTYQIKSFDKLRPALTRGVARIFDWEGPGIARQRLIYGQISIKTLTDCVCVCGGGVWMAPWPPTPGYANIFDWALPSLASACIHLSFYRRRGSQHNLFTCRFFPSVCSSVRPFVRPQKLSKLYIHYPGQLAQAKIQLKYDCNAM